MRLGAFYRGAAQEDITGHIDPAAWDEVVVRDGLFSGLHGISTQRDRLTRMMLVQLLRRSSRFGPFILSPRNEL